MFSDLLVTELLEFRVEGEEEEGPGEGGGRGVGPGTEQVQDGHHQLVSRELGVGRPRPEHGPALLITGITEKDSIYHGGVAYRGLERIYYGWDGPCSRPNI